MLGHPAFLPAHPACQPQREALLAEQRVAAVAGADAPDQLLLGEVQDVARLGIEVADGVQARHELAAVLLERVHRHLAHARHDAHIGDDVGAIGDLDADLGVRRASGAHQVGDDVHRAARMQPSKSLPTRSLPRSGPSSCWLGRRPRGVSCRCRSALRCAPRRWDCCDADTSWDRLSHSSR